MKIFGEGYLIYVYEKDKEGEGEKILIHKAGVSGNVFREFENGNGNG